MGKRRRIELKDPTQQLTLRSGIACELGSFDAATDADAKWVQVAREGMYLGYAGGTKPFVLSRASMQQAVDNLRAHPAFVAGVDGVGTGDVIAWDYNHASEQDPTSGNLPLTGAPAQGWTRDLKLEDDAKGKAKLMALTRFIGTAREYVKAGQYKWASIAASLNATHPETGKKVGLTLTSIALTNTPFIMGMEALAATQRAAEGGAGEDVHARWYDTAQTAEEACCSLKEMFGLPATSTVGDVVAEVQKIKQWVLSGTTPLGVDLEDILGSMRKILGIPPLTPIVTVLDSAAGIVQRFIEEEAAEAGEPLPATPPAIAATNAGRTDDMDIKVLASKHGVRENEEAVLRAIDENVELRASLVKQLGCKDDNRSLTAAVLVAFEAAVQLTAVHTALGTKDASATAGAIAQLSADAAELKKVKPEIEALRATQAAEESKSVEADVLAAMEQRGLADDDGLKLALTNLRKQDPKAFAERFPAKAPPAANANLRASLTRPLVASAGGGEHTARGATQALRATQQSKQPVLASGEGAIDLGMYPGRNKYERAMSYLTASQPGFAQLAYDDRFQAARQLIGKAGVIDSVTATAS